MASSSPAPSSPGKPSAADSTSILNDANFGTTDSDNNATSSTHNKPFLSNTVGSMFEGMEPGAVLRMTYVLVVISLIIAVYFAIKMYRFRRQQNNGLRRYDVLSAKQLQPEMVIDSESDDDELFAQDHTKLINQRSPAEGRSPPENLRRAETPP